MGASYIQIIFIDSEDLARHTNLVSERRTNAETWSAFKRYRRHGVPKAKATFLLDYYNSQGDLSDTIAIDDGGFRAITGQKPRSEADYLQIDADYWVEARKVA